MQGSREKIVKIYVWLMFGLLLCAGIAMMKMSGSVDVNNLMNQDRVYDFSKGEISQEQEIKKLPGKKQWNYLRIDIDDWAGVQSECRITIYNKNGKILDEQTAIVCNGKNHIELSYGKPFKYIGVAINALQGEKVPVKKMQLRMNSIEFEKNTFFPVFIVLFLVYLVLTAYPVLKTKGMGKADRAIALLQYAYALPGNYLGNKLHEKVGERKLSTVRSLMFALVFAVGVVMEISGTYMDSNIYKYGILLQILLLFVIAIFSWERPLIPKMWQGALVTSWFLLWIWVCVSDFLVSKYFKFAGYVFLVVVVLFFYIWEHMEHPERMTEDMLRGLRFTFFPVFLYMIICRKRYVGILYNGAFRNRESMAVYMLAVLLAFLMGLYFEWRKPKKAQRNWCLVIDMISISLCAYFLYRTHVVSCIVAAGIVFSVFLGYFIYLLYKKKISIPVLVLSAGISFGCVLAVNMATLYLPDLMETNIIYVDEKWETDLDDTAIAEIEAAAPGYFALVSKVSECNKALIWENYARTLSFFGSGESYVKVRGENTFAYSGWLEMLHRYGMFVLIPYSLLFFSCLWYGGKRKDILTITLTLAFLIVMSVQNVEIPFVNCLWLLFYLNIGSLFRKS